MPKRVDHDERRELIADALMRVAATQGLESVSVRHVAAEAGVTPGMVQHYFDSKDSMMGCAMQAASRHFEERITAAIAALGAEPSPRDLLGAVLGELLPSTAENDHAGRVALAFMAWAATRPHAAATLERGNAELRAFVTGRLQDAGVASAERTALSLLALVDGLGVQILSGNLPVEEAREALTAQLDDVFATREGAT